MRLVFDTNVYVSAFAVPKSKLSKLDLAIRLAALSIFDLIVSSAILGELRSKLSEPRFGFSEPEPDRVESSIKDVATVVEAETRLSVLEDGPDNRILECTLPAKASAIVTGDKYLLAPKAYEGVGIMTVAELLYTFREGA